MTSTDTYGTLIRTITLVITPKDCVIHDVMVYERRFPG